jgi:hypothetical protein
MATCHKCRPSRFCLVSTRFLGARSNLHKLRQLLLRCLQRLTDDEVVILDSPATAGPAVSARPVATPRLALALPTARQPSRQLAAQILVAAALCDPRRVHSRVAISLCHLQQSLQALQQCCFISTFGISLQCSQNTEVCSTNSADNDVELPQHDFDANRARNGA